MSDCNFREGQHVGIPAFGGTCAEILSKERLGTGWQLWVRLPSGNEISVSCDSVGPCNRMVPAVEADALGPLDNPEVERPAAARRLSTFEQIDSHVRGSELLNLDQSTALRAAEGAGPEDKLQEIARSFQVVRPILEALQDSPFLRGAWRQALNIHLELMDSCLGTGTEPPSES